jgi:serine/threonine protein kinase
MPLFSEVRCPGCGAKGMVRSRSGDFILTGVLGHGGSGRVFRARKSSGGVDVALKVLEKGMEDYEGHLVLLRNEASSAGMVDHPGIVRFLSLEEDGEGARLSMELMEGGSLHDRIASSGRLAESEVIRMGIEMVDGLAAVHWHGIVHRDLKPANILFDSEGAAKLGDFGLALSTRSKPVRQSHLLATPDYVSPEMLTGYRGDAVSDIYSLGGCLLHSLAGHPPHRTEGLSLPELRVLKTTPVSIPRDACSTATRRLLLSMLEADPARRVRSLEHVGTVLRSALVDSEKRSMGGIAGALAGIWKKVMPPAGDSGGGRRRRQRGGR